MNGFTIYKEYYDLITLLSKREAEELSLAIMSYMFEDIDPELNEKQMKIFNNLKRPLDASKMQSKRRTKKEPNENQKETEKKPNNIPKETHQDVYVNNNVNVNSIKEDRVIGEEEKDILDFIEKQEMIITPANYNSLTYFIGKVKTEDIEQALLLGKSKSFNYTIQTLRNMYKEQTTIDPCNEVSEELQEVLDYDWINEGEEDE